MYKNLVNEGYRVNKYGEQFKAVKFREFVGEFEIDFDFFIPYSLGCSNLLHNKIKTIYKENEELYFNRFKNSKYYQDTRLKALSVSNQIAVQNLLGILLTLESESKNKLIFELIKGPFKFISQYVEKSKIIDIYEIRDISLDYAKKNKLDVIFGSVHVFIITLYLCDVLLKDIMDEKNKTSFILIKTTIDSCNIEKSNYPQNIMNLESINNFKSKYSKFPLKKFEKLSLNHFITELNAIYKLDNSLGMNSNEEINSLIENHDFNVGLSFIGTYLAKHDIDVIDLQNITSESAENINMILDYIYEWEKQDSGARTPGYLLGIILILDALTRDYNKVKYQLLNTSVEEALNEVYQLKNQYKAHIDALTNVKDELTNKIHSQIDIINKQEQNLRTTEKENQKLVSDYEKLREENRALELIINDLQQANKGLFNKIDTIGIDLDEMIEYMQNKKIVVVGGDSKWVAHLNNTLPKLKHIATSDVNRNLKYIQNQDAIFFNYENNSHTMYYKIKKILQETNTPLYYIENRTNKSNNIEYMYKKMHS